MKRNGIEFLSAIDRANLIGEPLKSEPVDYHAEWRGLREIEECDRMVDIVVRWARGKWPKIAPETIGYVLRKAATKVYRQGSHGRHTKDMAKETK